MQKDAKYRNKRHTSFRGMLKNARFVIDRLKHRRLIGQRYLPVEEISYSPGTRTYKGINITAFPFTWCLIREGFSEMAIDPFGRNGSDQLFWRKMVIRSLQDYLNTPKYLDFIPDETADFLVTEFIDGEKLPVAISRWTAGTKWNSLDPEVRIRLLRHYLDIVDLVERMHRKGFVHRGIAPNHFIVRPSGKIAVLNVSRVYSVDHLMPEPPFSPFPSTYAAPEQLRNLSPTFKEDIYSLGALFIFFATGMDPAKFTRASSADRTEMKLSSEISNRALAETISRCLSAEPGDRPSLNSIKYEVVHTLHELIFNRKYHGGRCEQDLSADS